MADSEIEGGEVHIAIVPPADAPPAPVVVTGAPSATEELAEAQLADRQKSEAEERVRREREVSDLRSELWTWQQRVEALEAKQTTETVEPEAEAEPENLPVIVPVESEEDQPEPEPPQRPFLSRLLRG